MYLVIIGWLYVAVLMSVAEATNSNGTLLGAIVTFFLYGLLPIGLAAYILGTPARRKAIRARTAAESQATSAPPGSSSPDAGGHATAATEAEGVAPMREKP